MDLPKFALFNYVDAGGDSSLRRASQPTGSTAKSEAGLVIRLQIPHRQSLYDEVRGRAGPRKVYVKYLESTSVATDSGSVEMYWSDQLSLLIRSLYHPLTWAGWLLDDGPRRSIRTTR